MFDLTNHPYTIDGNFPPFKIRKTELFGKRKCAKEPNVPLISVEMVSLFQNHPGVKDHFGSSLKVDINEPAIYYFN